MEISHRENNFDFIRVAAAYLVLISHCWVLFGREPEFIASLGYESGSEFAVSIFFFITGYLMCGSLLRHKNFYHFVVSRVLRILPGLTVSVGFCVFVIGPVYTDLPASEYFASEATWRYLGNISIFPMHFSLPGVFESAPARGSVNGSLWTLPVEFAMYGVLFILFNLGLLKGSRAIVIAAMFICFSMLGRTFMNLSWENRGYYFLGSVPLFNFLDYGGYFFSGSVYRIYAHSIKRDRTIALAAILVLLCSASSPAKPFVEVLTIPYIVYYCAYSSNFPSRITSYTGDISYGVYIFAYPIQQAVYASTSSFLGFWQMMTLSLAVTTLFGILSWRFVEKPMLSLKKRLLAGLFKISHVLAPSTSETPPKAGRQMG